jgi:hypothetical protein
MKALVLSYDKQIGLAQLLVKSYERFKVNQFEFVVPINDITSRCFFESNQNVICRLSQSDILSSMKTVLDDCEDDEWVYWVIDDRFLTAVDLPVFNKVFDGINAGLFDFANGIKLINWRETLTNETAKLLGLTFIKQQPTGMFGFWHHQFLRAKVLKHAFFEQNTLAINNIREFNNHHHRQGHLAFLEDIYVCESNIIALEEPLWNGQLTKNGLEYLKRYDCKVPAYPVVDSVLGFKNFDEQIINNPKQPKYL